MADLWDDEEFWDLEGERFKKTILPFVVAILVDGMIAGYTGIGVAFDREMVNQMANEYAETYTYELVKGINQTSREFLQDAIPKWMQSGEHLDVLVDQIAQSGMFGEVRAQMIAMTETTRVYHQGKVASWKSSEMVERFRFMTAEDELVCPICSANNGQTFGLDDMENAPPLHVNCRCNSIPVLKGETE